MKTNKSRLYYNRFTHNAAKKSASFRSRAHSLRVKDEIEKQRPIDGIKPTLDRVCKPEKMKNNSIYIFDKLINPDDQNALKEGYERINKFHKEQNPPATTKEKIERSKANDVRAKLRRYVKNEENESIKSFFSSVAERVGFEVIDYETELNSLKTLEEEHGKIKQFGAKIKSLKEASEVEAVGHGLGGLTVTSADFVYKFTDNSEINLSNEQLKEIADWLHGDLFGDFTRTYLAIHADENTENPHFHFEISGKSNVSGKFEMNQAIFERIRDTPEGQAVEWSSNRANELTRDEITQLGQCIQTRVFNKTGEFLLEFGFSPEQLPVKRTAEEVEADKFKFFDKHRPTTARTYNWANKEKEEMVRKAKRYEKGLELKAEKEVDIKAKNYAINKRKKIDEEMKVYETAERSRLAKKIDDWVAGAKKTVFLALDAIVSDRIFFNKFFNKPFNELKREIRKNTDKDNNVAKEWIEQHDFNDEENPHKNQQREQNKKDVLSAFNDEKKRRKRKFKF